MRRALVVGIDYYDKVSPLYGCVNDSLAVKTMLERHEDGRKNFDVRHLAGTAPQNTISRDTLRRAIQDLFAGDGGVALLYFAGHGHIESTGGYLCSSDVTTGNDGVSLSDIMIMANKSRWANRLIILDSCHGGVAGGNALQQNIAEINEGVTILTASTAEQYALETGAGVFTSLLIDALGGAAANLLGDVTPGGVYAHIDQSLGPWALQRPVFKTNVTRFVSLRNVHPPLDVEELRKLSKLFPSAGHELQLNPTFEPERYPSWATDPQGIPAPDLANNKIFAILQKYNRVGLVVPVGAPSMWHAAMTGKTVRLTAVVEYYRQLTAKELI